MYTYITLKSICSLQKTWENAKKYTLKKITNYLARDYHY